MNRNGGPGGPFTPADHISLLQLLTSDHCRSHPDAALVLQAHRVPTHLFVFCMSGPAKGKDENQSA